jgi:hypothetical protein
MVAPSRKAHGTLHPLWHHSVRNTAGYLRCYLRKDKADLEAIHMEDVKVVAKRRLNLKESLKKGSQQSIMISVPRRYETN